jgi:hypothetical protein
MDEKMMICPKAGECDQPDCNKTLKDFAEHSRCAYEHWITIPVPSTPASDHIGDVTEMIAQHGTNVAPSTPSSVPLPPDELLRKLKEDVAAEIQYLFQGKRPPTWSDGVKQMRLEQADVILLKCHQSEAAEIASLQADIEELNILSRCNSEVYDTRIKQLELGKKLSMESDNRIEQAIGKVLGYPAYKDDQKNFPNATESNGVCVGDHVAESLVMELVDRFKTIRADQNKKIGEWGNEPCPHRNNDFPFPKAVPSELQMPKRECRDCWQEKSGVAKLQKGDF